MLPPRLAESGIAETAEKPKPLVTVEEALEVADRVVVMGKGRIEQIGTPQEVYEAPHTAFVHEFIGESIVVPVNIERGAVHFNGHPIGLEPQGVSAGPARLFVRPYDMNVVSAGEAALTGEVRRIHGLGASRRVEIALPEENLVEVDVPRPQGLEIGQTVGLLPRRYRVF